MINADMRDYSFYLYTDNNDYGQPALTEEAQGTIKMAIFTSSQAIQDNINYNGAQYVGMTTDARINDKWVIEHESGKLKVLYIQTKGRFTQVYLGAM